MDRVHSPPGPHRFPTGSCKGAATAALYMARRKGAGRGQLAADTWINRRKGAAIPAGPRW